MKRTFTVIRGGLYRDVKSIEEQIHARSKPVNDNGLRDFQELFKAEAEKLGMSDEIAGRNVAATAECQALPYDRRLYSSEFRL